MAIDFPNSPTNGQTFTSNGRTWTYNGSVWNLITGVANHASTHAAGGADPVTLAQSQITNLTTDLASKVPYTGFNAAGKNIIINGAFDYWQRGTSMNGGLFTYIADRFMSVANHTGGTINYSKQNVVAGNPLGGSTFLRMTATSPTGATANALTQRVEDVSTLAGQTATFSVYLKADTARTIYTNIFQDFGSGGSGQVGTTQAAFNVTTTWQRFSTTVSIPSVSGKTIGTGNYLGVELLFPVNTSSTIDVFGYQFEAGSTASAFSRAGGTLQGELAACQRYYWRAGGGGENYPLFVHAFAYNSTSLQVAMQFPVTMRVKPYSVGWSGLQAQDIATGSTTLFTSIANNGATPQNMWLLITGASGLTNYRQYSILANNNPNAYIDFSAEL